jgi:hypothetical protein
MGKLRKRYLMFRIRREGRYALEEKKKRKTFLERRELY